MYFTTIATLLSVLAFSTALPTTTPSPKDYLFIEDPDVNPQLYITPHPEESKPKSVRQAPMILPVGGFQGLAGLGGLLGAGGIASPFSLQPNSCDRVKAYFNVIGVKDGFETFQSGEYCVVRFSA